MKTYRKPYKIKRKKSILKSRFFWLIILILVIFSGIFYLIFFHSFFQIKVIEISGNEKVSTENLKNLLNEKINRPPSFFGWGVSSRSIFLLNFREIKRDILESFPHVRKVDLKRKFPETLSLAIEERKPIAIFYQAEKFFLIDSEGVIFELLESGSERQDLIKFKKLIEEELILGDKIISEEQLSKILETESKLKNELKILTEEILVVSEVRFDVKSSEGFKIYFSFQEDLTWQLTKLKALLEEEISAEKRKELEYIDVRFENYAVPVYHH